MKTYPLADQNQQHQLKLATKLQQGRKKGLLQQKKHEVYREETDVALVVGRAAWWVPVLATNSNMQNLTFAEALRDFLQNVSFHCYGKLVETGRRYQERLFWLVFHVASLSTLIIFLWHSRNTRGQSLTTTVHDSFYPIHKVPLPAVSICSINRISNLSATRYAEELNRKDTLQRGTNFFYEQIKMLQYNYYVPNETIPDYNKALAFQSFLDMNDRDDSELFYNTRRRMASLSPNCSDIFQQCRLGGKIINCAEEFKETFTSLGLCCSFNNDYKYSVKGIRREFFGQNMGLILLLSAPYRDNFYKLFMLNGFMVSIHAPTFHPFQLSGGFEEYVALTGISTYFPLAVRTHETVDEVRFISPKTRNCLFRDELPTLYGNKYTFNNCIALCRIRSIIVMCGCMPFHAPYENFSSPVDTVFCSLQHKECLMHYEFKWLNVITKRTKARGLEREMEESLYCPQCLPSCSETQYATQVMKLPLNKYNMKPFSDCKQNYSELAMVRIYFSKTDAVLLKKVLINSWFEIFGSVGGICGLITGFSLIGICEVVYFFLRQILAAYKNEALRNGNRKPAADQALIILP